MIMCTRSVRNTVLKKARTTIAAANGATTRQPMAMFDWTTVAMAEIYIRAAEQKHLAG